MFLTRTSCHNTTHADGYCGAWPGWAVSVSVLSLTQGQEKVDVPAQEERGNSPFLHYVPL